MENLSVEQMVNHRVWGKLREQGNEYDQMELSHDNIYDINSYVNAALDKDILEDELKLGLLFSEAIEKVMTQWD